MSRCTDLDRTAVLDALRSLGGAVPRRAVWDVAFREGRYIDVGRVGQCLRELERHGLAFANDGNGTLARWGGLRRGGYWSTRESLERSYGYGPAELGPAAPQNSRS